MRRIRIEVLDYSQSEMARALRLSPRTYQRYEYTEVLKVPAMVLEEARRLASLRGETV